MNDKNKRMTYGIVWAVIVIVIIWLICSSVSGNKKAVSGNAVSTEASDTEKQETKIVEVEKFVEVEKTITSEILQDGLRDMGVLITEEYYLTQVESYEKTKTYLQFITTSSNFVYSYDATVGAGLNFGDIELQKDDDSKVITITLPESDIQYVDIDYDSFQIYSEKEGLWNPTTIEDYNESLKEFENNAKQKAIDKGVLEKADENAKTIIENFISGMVDTSEYSIEWR